ncbi:hypothetical protein HS088_TW21G00098 [Tripterygium wilfordii]|uniref:Uncharacterized protein n=1 Tax=Tripterygium wilfordii TaxID=458696 RepID=A0A7J7C1H8_TRIWF|nr:hypothetical protein HS088_TW21G00098 [Tripterygium wilfordii]
MSKLLSRIAGLFSSRSISGIDKTGNRYFARKEEIDGIVKEKRWVIFKGEEDPTTIPVLKKEEVEKRAKEGPAHKVKAGGPDLKSFIRKFPSSEADKAEEVSGARDDERSKETEAGKAKEEPSPE